MLDLKSKLAAAGLVTKEDIDRVEKPGAGGKGKRRGGRDRAPGKGDGAGRGGAAAGGGAPRLKVASLLRQSKGEQYEAVRRFIERVRLYDPARPPTEQAQTFHFSTAKGQIGRLVLEPEVASAVQDGSAGLVAYMSNHGIAHTVVPAAAARDLAELFPLWLRVLKDHPGAGRTESEMAAELATETAAPPSPSPSEDADASTAEHGAPAADRPADTSESA